MVLQLLTSALEASCPILKSHCPLSYCHAASWFVPGPRMARRNTTGSSRHLEGAGAESSMMQTVQLAIADGMYAAALREALSRSCAWHVESVGRPDPSQHCVMVLDQSALGRLPLPLSNPERIVLITHKRCPTDGRSLGGRHRIRGQRARPHQHRPAGHHGRGVACRQTPRILSPERDFPQRRDCACATTPIPPEPRIQTLQNSIV